MYYIWASLIAQLVKNPPAMQETRFNSWVWNIRWRRDRLPTSVFLGFPCSSAGKESACNAGDLGSIPGLGRSPGEGNGYPLQYSGLENPMDCVVHGMAKSRLCIAEIVKTQHCNSSILQLKKKKKNKEILSYPKVLRHSSMLSFKCFVVSAHVFFLIHLA